MESLYWKIMRLLQKPKKEAHDLQIIDRRSEVVSMVIEYPETREK